VSDVFFIALVLVFFLLAALYARFAPRL